MCISCRNINNHTWTWISLSTVCTEAKTVKSVGGKKKMYGAKCEEQSWSVAFKPDSRIVPTPLHNGALVLQRRLTFTRSISSYTGLRSMLVLWTKSFCLCSKRSAAASADLRNNKSQTWKTSGPLDRYRFPPTESDQELHLWPDRV